GGRPLRLTDADRRRLAALAHRIGRRALRQVATVVTPDTLLRWHRQLVAQKWTYARPRANRRGVMTEIRALVVRMAHEQVVRQLTLADQGLGPGHVLICDRDTKWSPDARRLLREAGVRVVVTPIRAPNANAYAERFVRSIKEECLNRVIPIGEHHF